MSRAMKYRVKAIEHAQLAISSQSDEVCEMHVRMAASFLSLANKEAMRDLNLSRSRVGREQFNLPMHCLC